MDKWGRICPPFATFDGQAENRYLFDFVEKALSPLRVNLGVSPEKNQPFGQAAKNFTISLAAQKEVRVEVLTLDRYGRMVAEVVLPGGDSLGSKLVEEGFAWHFKRYSTSQVLDDLECRARLDKKGLWRDSEPVPPWEWRKRKA